MIEVFYIKVSTVKKSNSADVSRDNEIQIVSTRKAKSNFNRRIIENNSKNINENEMRALNARLENKLFKCLLFLSPPKHFSLPI
jgi:hypothetical protein